MTRILTAISIALVCFAGYQVAGMLSSDALGMALGILLGILAGLPTRILVAAQERQERHPQPQRPQIVEQNYYVHMDAPRAAAELPHTYRRELTG